MDELTIILTIAFVLYLAYNEARWHVAKKMFDAQGEINNLFERINKEKIELMVEVLGLYNPKEAARARELLKQLSEIRWSDG